MSGIIGGAGSKSGVIGLPNGAGIEDNWSSNAGSSITLGTDCEDGGITRELYKNNVTGQVQGFFFVKGWPTGTSSNQTIATLPSGYVPKVTLYLPMICTNWASVYSIRVYPTSSATPGRVYIWGADYVGTARSNVAHGIYFTATWFAG